MNTIAIYHKDCSDGTTAAAVVLRKYPDALLFPLSHGFESHELEPILSQAKPGDRIFTVDCVMGVKEFLEKGFEVTSIDHHVGVQTEMEDLAKVNKKFTFVFDNKKSGASLAWAYFFPDEETPEIIKYVEDADLWTWKYGDTTKDIGNILYLLNNKPEEILNLFDASLETIKRDGRAISSYTNNIVEKSVEKTEPIYLTIANHRIPFYNITTLQSESGNRLSTIRKEAVGLFSIDGNKVKISFRSLDGQTPTALDLAKALGGGGHIKAAGAGITLDHFIKSIVK